MRARFKILNILVFFFFFLKLLKGKKCLHLLFSNLEDDGFVMA